MLFFHVGRLLCACQPVPVSLCLSLAGNGTSSARARNQWINISRYQYIRSTRMWTLARVCACALTINTRVRRAKLMDIIIASEYACMHIWRALVSALPEVRFQIIRRACIYEFMYVMVMTRWFSRLVEYRRKVRKLISRDYDDDDIELFFA